MIRFYVYLTIKQYQRDVHLPIGMPHIGGTSIILKRTQQTSWFRRTQGILRKGVATPWMVSASASPEGVWISSRWAMVQWRKLLWNRYTVSDRGTARTILKLSNDWQSNDSASHFSISINTKTNNPAIPATMWVKCRCIKGGACSTIVIYPATMVLPSCYRQRLFFECIFISTPSTTNRDFHMIWTTSS